MRPKGLISAEAKKSPIKDVSSYLNDIDWLCHLATFLNYNNFGTKKGGQVAKPIILVKICYKLLYVIQVV